MTEWVREGLEGRNFKSILRLYGFGVAVLAPVAAVVGLVIGSQALFQVTPFLVVTFVAIQYISSHLVKASESFPKSEQIPATLYIVPLLFVGVFIILGVLATRIYQTEFITWLFIPIGIILTQAIILYIKFYDRAEGYMLRAASRVWQSLVTTFVVEAIVAIILTHLASIFILIPQPLLAVLSGITVVLLINTLEYFFLHRNVSVERLRNPLAKALLKLNLAIVHKFRGAILTRLEQDVFDIQAGWELNIPPGEIRTRVREIYSYHARDIAQRRKDPKLMNRATGFLWFEQLYLLLEHLGRERLKAELQTHSAWSGKERRKKRGSIKDRVVSGLSPRLYDDDELKKLVAVVHKLREFGT